TVAALASANATTVLWARRAELVDEINSSHTNGAYLPGFELPAGLVATASMDEAVGGADAVVMAVPSHGFRVAATQAAPFVADDVPVVSLSKGLEIGTQRRMTEVAAEEFPGHPVGVLTGPNLAAEIMAGHPAASVVAFADHDVASAVGAALAGPTLRI